MFDHGDHMRDAALFATPSREQLRSLTPAEFHQFVAYVFRRAGYEVKGHPLRFATEVDLDLFSTEGTRKQVGAVAIRHAPPENAVSGQLVRKLQRSAAVRKGGAVAYIVTNGGYDRSAYEHAGMVHRTCLLDGAQLCRYAQYVRNSRFPEGSGLRVMIPPDLFSGERLPLQTMRHTRVLVLANNKGGVGKTTSARHLALNMATRGLCVLVVDMDPQGNLSEALTDGQSRHPSAELGNVSANIPSIVQYFAGQGTLLELVRPASIEKQPVSNVYLIPSHPDLSLLDTGGAGRPELEMSFARDLLALVNAQRATSDRYYDWVILDTPPAISLFTRAALCAADYVIVPARSRPSSLAGIRNMMGTLDTMSHLKGTPPNLLGCLLTHWDEDQHSTETYPRLEELFDNRHSRILANYIPFDVTVEKMHGQTQHRASDAYERVTQEVLEYAQHH